jgi:hypothetical protein
MDPPEVVERRPWQVIFDLPMTRTHRSRAGKCWTMPPWRRASAYTVFACGDRVDCVMTLRVAAPSLSSAGGPQLAMGERMDDFDVEVSALESAPATPSIPMQDSEGRPAPHAATGAAPQEPIARRVSFAPRLTCAQRLQRTGSLIALLAVLVSALLLVPAGTRATVLRLLTPPTPAPTATPQAGADAFLWEHAVPWGQLLVDGKPGPDVRGSAMYQDSQGFPLGSAFHLSRGRHTLEYRAAPFPTVRCAVSVPPARSDTCPLARATSPISCSARR